MVLKSKEYKENKKKEKVRFNENRAKLQPWNLKRAGSKAALNDGLVAQIDKKAQQKKNLIPFINYDSREPYLVTVEDLNIGGD